MRSVWDCQWSSGCAGAVWRKASSRALNRKKQLRRRQKRLDGEREARLIAMACGEPPEGRASWTLKLLADQLVECEIVETISTETVRQVLKKANSSRG